MCRLKVNVWTNYSILEQHLEEDTTDSEEDSEEEEEIDWNLESLVSQNLTYILILLEK